MSTVNMLAAKTNLSKLVEAVETGAESEIIIARNGRPAARLVPVKAPASAPRIGLLKGKYKAPVDPFAGDDEIAAMFAAGREA